MNLSRTSLRRFHQVGMGTDYGLRFPPAGKKGGQHFLMLNRHAGTGAVGALFSAEPSAGERNATSIRWAGRREKAA